MNRIKKEIGSGDIKVIATGGYSDIFKEETGVINFVEQSLTLLGLRIIFDGDK